jgi:hypothetical protein
MTVCPGAVRYALASSASPWLSEGVSVMAVPEPTRERRWLAVVLVAWRCCGSRPPAQLCAHWQRQRNARNACRRIRRLPSRILRQDSGMSVLPGMRRYSAPKLTLRVKPLGQVGKSLPAHPAVSAQHTRGQFSRCPIPSALFAEPLQWPSDRQPFDFQVEARLAARFGPKTVTPAFPWRASSAYHALDTARRSAES